MPTRERILDAAEELFSLKGFEGATLRDITHLAGVPLGLANHYFNSKEGLFREVIERRAVVHVADIERELARVHASIPTGSVRIDDIIRAYVEPLLLRASKEEQGWRNYCRLLSLTLNSSHYKDYVKSTLRLFNDNYAHFIGAIRQLYPHCDDRALHWSTYFLQASVIHILAQAGMVDRQSEGLCQSAEFEQILTELVPFFAISFHASLTSGKPSRKRKRATESLVGKRFASCREPSEPELSSGSTRRGKAP